MMKWYPFELHCHTNHSDGSMSPAELVHQAVLRGLSGIAVTDHNTASAVEEVEREAKKAGLIVIRGIEWTTFWGHFTVLGGKSRVDWRDVTPNTVNDKIKEAREAGDVVCVAHPYRPGGVLCTGCYMDFEVDFNNVDAMEVWSQDNPSLSIPNKLAYEKYLYLVAMATKITPLYGYDWHTANEQYIGTPIYKTYLRIDGEVTPVSALDAIKKGRTCIASATPSQITAHGGALNTGRNTQAFFAKMAEVLPDAIEVDVRRRGKTLYLSHNPHWSYKNHLTLRDAFAFVKTHGMKINCDLKEKGIMPDCLTLAKEMGVQDHVIFTGHCLPRHLKKVDCAEIYVNKSFYESVIPLTPATLAKVWEHIKSHNCPHITGLNLDYRHHGSDALIAKAKELNIPLSFYTVDDPQLLRHYLNLGIANVTTNLVDIAYAHVVRAV